MRVVNSCVLVRAHDFLCVYGRMYMLSVGVKLCAHFMTPAEVLRSRSKVYGVSVYNRHVHDMYIYKRQRVSHQYQCTHVQCTWFLMLNAVCMQRGHDINPLASTTCIYFC